jgi:hypothetical protein
MMAAAVKMPISVQSSWTPWPSLETRADALLMAITSSEVPTATGIVKPSARTRAGTTAKPPPTPKNPVSRPTADAVASTFAARGHAQTKRGANDRIGSCEESGLSGSPDRPWRRLRANISTATASMSIENAASKTFGATLADIFEPNHEPAVPSTPKARP